MSIPLPRDVDDFLFALGTFEEGVPDDFENYAKASANLLWAKYVLFADSSIRVKPGSERDTETSSPLTPVVEKNDAVALIAPTRPPQPAKA